MIQIIVTKHGVSRTHAFAGTQVVVGSAADADLVLEDPGVAARHVQLSVRYGVLMVEDLRRAGRPPRAIDPVDIVRIAYIDLRAKIDDDAFDDAGLRLLDEIRQRPDDPAPRMVYADWCEEHGHPERAEFLRQQIAIGEASSASDPSFRQAAARLEALAPEVGHTWRTRVAMAFIERCPKTLRAASGTPPPEAGFELVCPMRWDKLTPTGRDDVRTCSGCQREVTYATTVRQALHVAQRGGCVAIDVTLGRVDLHNLDLEPRVTLGRMAATRWDD